MKDDSTVDTVLSKDLIVPEQHEISPMFHVNDDTAYIDGEFETSFENNQDDDPSNDKVEISSEVVSTIGGGAVGAVAAGTIASAAGASTLLGSTSLASALGGIFVTTTPIGWIVGTAAVAGAAGYSISKLIKSRKKNKKRDEVFKKLELRVMDLKNGGHNKFRIIEFKCLLLDVLEKDQISELKAGSIVSQIENGSLSVEAAIERIKVLIHLPL